MNERPATANWTELRERLEAVKRAIDGGRTVEPGEQKAILRRRAEELAREDANDPEKKASLDVLSFTLASETYGIEASFVREVFNLEELTPVPRAPAFIAGVLNLRGTMLTLIDIKKFFDLPESGITDIHKVITIRHTTLHLGLLADTLPGLREVNEEQMQTSLPTLTGLRADYLKGVLPDLIVLDMEKILSDERIVVNQP